MIPGILELLPAFREPIMDPNKIFLTKLALTSTIGGIIAIAFFIEKIVQGINEIRNENAKEI